MPLAGARQLGPRVGYRTEPDNTIGPLIRTYHGPLARLRSWWHTRTPHTID